MEGWSIEKLLNEVRAYSTKADEYERIIKVYGISQDPDTKNYIIVLHYAAGGDFNNWINKNENYKYFNWKSKVRTLYNIASGLKVIHKKQMVHHDFHTGNVLFNTTTMKEYANKIYISDMGLCGGVDDINQNNIYGVMPYIAPEVLRGKPYTQAADIYSFGMIMYFAATGRQPFDDCAHDHYLALDICNGIRPIINEPEAPKSYIDLMKKCLDSNPENRPDIDKLSKLLWSVTNIKSEIEKAENYRNLQLSSLKGDRQIITHPQAIYTSRLLNQFTKDLPKYDNSECLDCAILD
ncbi:kinase-like domain-containing protein [Rhizophagus irregularis DAOM 181602=DAOM 197198]|nr:kinase-like domain-containing protein [Rhizophagus irregularis DAOM 181602=DAOM 197198]